MKILLPSGNALISPTRCKAIHIPTVHFPRQPSGLSPLNAHVTGSRGTVMYVVSNYASGGQWFYILQYNTSSADLAFWVNLNSTFIAPNAPFNTPGWTQNFYFKLHVVDKLSAVQFNAL